VSLRTLQERFLDAVLADAPLEGVAPADALDVYRRNARVNHQAALAAAYPVVRRLVGDAFFAEAARRYVRASPASSGDLHGYGASLPSFLEAYGPAQGLAYLPDVARLEWAVHESFHAADAPGFDFEALGRLAPDAHGALRFRLDPDVRLVASRYPVLAIWEANQPPRDGSPDRAEGADCVLVRREGFEAIPRAIDATAWRFLDALRRGSPLEEASDALGAAARSLPALLAHWISVGVIGGFEASGARV
jgi:hypothetical protein